MESQTNSHTKNPKTYNIEPYHFTEGKSIALTSKMAKDHASLRAIF